MNTPESVTQRINEIVAIATQRRLACNPELAAEMGGAGIDFLSPSEREELHRLKMELPTCAELRDQAKDRIAARIAARNAERRARCLASTPNHAH